MSDQIDRDDIFAALSNRRRRQVIRLVAEGDTNIGALSEAIARDEHDIPGGVRVDGDLRKRVYIALYQGHLDRLDAWGIVEWEKDSGYVAAGPAHEETLQALRAATDDESSDSITDRVRSFVGGEA